MQLQLSSQFALVDKLHHAFGSAKLLPVYGAGNINKPKIMLLFMNPTGRNVSAISEWKGIRAPWLGTKNIWKMLEKLGLVDELIAARIASYKPHEWTPEFSENLYHSLARQGIYITNLAKCTQIDARPLPNSVFIAYREQVLNEIYEVDPENIVSFGNQVSSILLEKLVSVSGYTDNFEQLQVKDRTYKVFPCYYPVGQGTPNMPKALTRINQILTNYA